MKADDDRTLTDSRQPSGYWRKMRTIHADLSRTLEAGGQRVLPLALEFATVEKVLPHIKEPP
jgi:hypothetical protein